MLSETYQNVNFIKDKRPETDITLSWMGDFKTHILKREREREKEYIYI